MPEPWLRGIQLDVHPALAAVLFALQQVREDLAPLARLTEEEIWRQPPGVPPLGFHLRHIAGSVDRLTSYLCDQSLTAEQLDSLKEETSRMPTDRIFHDIEASLQRAETKIRALDPSEFSSVRSIGRQKLAVTAIGVAIHIGEHTQRHCGQAITTAKVVHAL